MNLNSKIAPVRHRRDVAAPEFASILIVDDQEFDRLRLRKLCAEFEFKTHLTEAASLAEMADKLRKDRFDLVLLDYHLSDGTGLQGVEAVRADPVNCTAATIMITGTEHRNIAVQALKLGFTDYLTKDELSDETLRRAAITGLQKAKLARDMLAQSALRNLSDDTLQSFSRECAQDIKPVVSRMMRQMRELRQIGDLSVEEATDRVERVEGSLRRLWAFLDQLEKLGEATQAPAMPTVPSVRGQTISPVHVINTRVPSERPVRAAPKQPPSLFRRRPD